MKSITYKTKASTEAPRPFTNEEHAKWALRVYNAQNKNLSPEDRKQMEEKWEKARKRQSQRTEMTALSCKSKGLKSKTWNTMKEVQECRVNAPAITSAPMQLAIASRAATEMEDEEELIREGKNEENEVSERDIQELLKEVQHEPKAEEEVTAKFTLYEKYGEKVQTIRGELFKFWGDNRESFPEAPRAAIAKLVNGIDGEDRMGIQDECKFWFVYQMMKQAAANHSHMEKIMQEIHRRLDFLAESEQTECPVCLEEFNENGNREIVVLGCCHQICSECWDHWRLIQGNNAFCPLCRNNDFMQEIHHRTAQH